MTSPHKTGNAVANAAKPGFAAENGLGMRGNVQRSRTSLRRMAWECGKARSCGAAKPGFAAENGLGMRGEGLVSRGGFGLAAFDGEDLAHDFAWMGVADHVAGVEHHEFRAWQFAGDHARVLWFHE